MSGPLTELTEITTALGTLAPNLADGMRARPAELRNVSDEVWRRLVDAYASGARHAQFETAFENGVALLAANDGLRGRRPRLVEWKGPHRPPGDDVIPADLRIDHVYLVSCKYLSRVLLNAGPARLFDRLLAGDDRSGGHWFAEVAPREFQAFYEATRAQTSLPGLPSRVAFLTKAQQRALRLAVAARSLPSPLQPAWADLCLQVSGTSARRWTAALTSERAKLRLLWKLLRISNAAYFVLGTDRSAHLRLRVASTWDWNQAFELADFSVSARPAGQPEVAWRAEVRARSTGAALSVAGHVEIRWSHGRFVGSPEAKIYLDTPHADVPGYYPLR